MPFAPRVGDARPAALTSLAAARCSCPFSDGLSLNSTVAADATPTNTGVSTASAHSREKRRRRTRAFELNGGVAAACLAITHSVPQGSQRLRLASAHSGSLNCFRSVWQWHENSKQNQVLSPRGDTRSDALCGPPACITRRCKRRSDHQMAIATIGMATAAVLSGPNGQPSCCAPLAT